ncbi:hypothetical protein OG21DRAFT_1481093 [Imleria badia]|nr:hypothetical protein OG21DRAFT_1481093 [Imleria badia]
MHTGLDGQKQDMDSATIRYRLNLPHALHPISPALSALHASRVAALHPEISAVLSPSHCPKCGTYHFSGDHPSYLVGPSTRKKRRRATHPKTLQRRCHLCGFSIDARTTASLDQSSVPVPSGVSRMGTVPATQRTKEIAQEPPTVQTTKCTPVPRPQSRPKPSHTKTSTLKNMLSRERQREEVVKSHKRRKEGHEGLAAFLKEL